MRWGCQGVNEGASSWQLRGNSWIRDDVSKPGSHSPRTSPRARSPQTSSRVSVFPPSYSRNEVIPELKKFCRLYFIATSGVCLFRSGTVGFQKKLQSQKKEGGITSFLLFEFHALWSRRWPTIFVCLSQHRDAKINGRGSLSHLMPVGRRGRELLLLLLLLVLVAVSQAGETPWTGRAAPWMP